MGRSSKVSPSNKVLLCKAVIKFIWTFGIVMMHIVMMLRNQNKILGDVIDARWHITNFMVQKNIIFIKDIIRIKKMLAS